MGRYNEEDEDIIEVDIKSIISKKISGKISDLEDQLAEAREINNKNVEKYLGEIKELKQENTKLNSIIEKTDMIAELVERLKTKFSSIQADPYVSGQHNESKASKQFKFIERLMKNLYGVVTAHKFHDGSLETNLAIAFYDNKEPIINLIKILDDKSSEIQSKISNFVMPYDYDKETVISIVKKSDSNVNGAYTGSRNYWVESGGKLRNMPWDLFLQNKHLLENDVFKLVLSKLKEHYGQGYLFFMLPKYNPNITLEQIRKIGRIIMEIPTNRLNYSEIEQFVSKHMFDFDDDTMEYFSKFTSEDNQFRLFHWDKFPPKYQYRHLMNKPVEEIIKLVTHYSNKWSEETYNEFFELYYKHKNANKTS